MLDLDHFKAINDRYGHAAGDKVLRATTAAWQAQLRGRDPLGRVGGEEFLHHRDERRFVDALDLQLSKSGGDVAALAEHQLESFRGAR